MKTCPDITQVVVQPTNTNDYSAILAGYHLPHLQMGYHLQVGDPASTSGWILHLSIIAVQIPEALKTILPFLTYEKSPFKIPATQEIAKSILNGQLGYTQLGKIITIYPKNEGHAIELATQLVNLSREFKGPRILTDRHLGSALYVRYGAHIPIIIQDENGVQETFFHNESGILIKDQYTIPFVLPTGISWPFGKFASSIVPKPETVLQHRYKPITTLKEDARGNVTKTLRLEKWWIVKWCVLKEGKYRMFSDEYGRDIQDRLKWQFDSHSHLLGILPVPKPYELFKENSDHYLALEYIKGQQLDTKITDLFRDRHWCSLEPDDQISLLNYSIDIIEIITKLHENGYVHRDINPGNFIVSKNGKLTLVDLELAYSIKRRQPQPPFKYGTPWFMSPEQQITLTPTFHEDIYAIGGTLICLLTGLLPSKFSGTDISLLQKQLIFYISDIKLAEIIAQCFHSTPSSRPTLQALKAALSAYKKQYQQIQVNSSDHIRLSKPAADQIRCVIQKGVDGLSAPIMINNENLWISKTAENNIHEYYQVESASIYPGFYVGLSGILYALSRAYIAGFSIGNCMPAYRKSYEYIQLLIKSKKISAAGLYAGTSGIARSLIQANEAGLITGKDALYKAVSVSFENTNIQGLGIAKGMAGRGLALLSSADLLGDDLVKTQLEEYVTNLAHCQQKDGSWLITMDDPNRHQKILGFGHGTAGIICFLLQYANRYNDSIVMRTAERGLSYLSKEIGTKDNWSKCKRHNKNTTLNTGLHDGWAGVILAFIKAYEISKNPNYKRIAETWMRAFPQNIVSRDITLATGLSGLGETYLEGYQTFQEEEWQLRAGWIANCLLHEYQEQPDGSLYWLVDHTPYSTADLMIGNSGLLHFLIRYNKPNTFTHPFLTS